MIGYQLIYLSLQHLDGQVLPVLVREYQMTGNFNVTTPHHRTHTHTHTLTFTHTNVWPTVASRSSGSWVFFYGFFEWVFGDQKWSAKRS